MVLELELEVRAPSLPLCKPWSRDWNPFLSVLIRGCHYQDWAPTVSGLSTGPCTCLLTARLKKKERKKTPKHFQWIPIMSEIIPHSTYHKKTLQPVLETDWSITQLLYQRHFQHVTYRNLTKMFHFQFTNINKNYQTIESKNNGSKSPRVLRLREILSWILSKEGSSSISNCQSLEPSGWGKRYFNLGMMHLAILLAAGWLTKGV